jgi:hypothetical protein
MPFTQQNPLFDGSLIYLSSLKESVCPGTFVFYRVNDEVAVGRILMQLAPGEVKINLFRAPVPNDRVSHLTHPFTNGCIEILQTENTAIISANVVYGICFVFSDNNILNGGVEVAGMQLVWMLRGHVTQHGSESIFVPSFPCQCDCFYDWYTIRADISFALWHDVVLCGVSLLTKCLSHSALTQGTEFCQKQSPSVSFATWKWDWLVQQIFHAIGRPLPIHTFCQSKKLITLRKGGQVIASSQAITQSWIRFQTPDELQGIKRIFGSWCLFGVRDKAPRIGTSIVITDNSLCNIVLETSGMTDCVFQQRTHNFGIDLSFDGTHFRIFARYRIISGRAAELSSFREAPTRDSHRNMQFSEAELSRVGMNTFFRAIDGRLMVVLSLEANTARFCF